MGLDMYLKLRRSKRELITNMEDVEDLKIFDDVNTAIIREVFTIGYWRKANAIFDMIERCVAYGEIENCVDLFVPESKVQEMLDICKQVKANPEKAEELLPTRSGFFFGPTTYDEWYFEDLNYTIELFEKVLKFLDTNNNREHYDVLFYAWW